MKIEDIKPRMAVYKDRKPRLVNIGKENDNPPVMLSIQDRKPEIKEVIDL